VVVVVDIMVILVVVELVVLEVAELEILLLEINRVNLKQFQPELQLITEIKELQDLVLLGDLVVVLVVLLQRLVVMVNHLRTSLDLSWHQQLVL
tara:strand:+ start:190 stop:471 length:282 start_codon:yes stop_codon:yes gene_type:complete